MAEPGSAGVVRILGLLILRESAWERELRRAHVEGMTALLAALRSESAALLPTELERRVAEHTDADGLVRFPRMTMKLDDLDPSVRASYLARLDPEANSTESPWTTVSRQLRWAVLGIPADPPIDLLAEAAELLRVKWPADGAIVDRDPGDETGTS